MEVIPNMHMLAVAVGAAAVLKQVCHVAGLGSINQNCFWRTLEPEAVCLSFVLQQS